MSSFVAPALVCAILCICVFTPLVPQTWKAINEVNACLGKADSFTAKALNVASRDDYKTMCYHTVAAPLVCGICRVSAFLSINDDLISDIPYCYRYCGLLTKGVEGVMLAKTVSNVIKVEEETGMITSAFRFLKNTVSGQ